jgi:hypothetical protein
MIKIQAVAGLQKTALLHDIFPDPGRLRQRITKNFDGHQDGVKWRLTAQNSL